MKTLLGVIFKTILALAVLLGIGVFALSYFANPERLKPYAIQFVQDKYHRTLSVGDIHWRVFPKLGLSLEDVVLSDNPAFGKATFAAMKTLSVFVDTMSLLQGHVNVKTVEVVDVTANVKTTAKGVNSWDDLTAAPTAADKAKINTTSDASTSSKEPGLSVSDLTFNIEKIEVQNGQFNYVDEKAGSTYKVTDFSFQGENIGVDKDFPVAIKFSVSSSAPAMAATVNAKASLKVAMKNGAVDPKSLVLNGTVDIPSLHMQGIKVSSLKAPVSIAGNVVKLNPISAAFYGGSVGGDAVIDASNVPTRVAVNYDLKGVNMGSMLKDMNGKDTITGTLNMKGKLAFNTSPVKKQMMQSVNGNAQMNVHNGILKGVDLPYFYAMGSNLLNRKNPIPTGKNTGQTNFNTTTANVNITKGVLTNKDLAILTSTVHGTGSGTVNLVSDQINYRFNIQGVADSKPTGPIIPLQITGSIENPTIGLDMNAVTQKVVQGAIQGAVKGGGGKGIGQQILKSLGGGGQ